MVKSQTIDVSNTAKTSQETGSSLVQVPNQESNSQEGAVSVQNQDKSQSNLLYDG